ncbi:MULTISPECIES: flagellar protein FlgN [Bacillaceae]|uniref:Flagellar protein FlgN n=1 Tax=Evansella alkalicola TaxID=745819 RepID=A0ABS6JT32_9BACI|nr:MULTISPECIES: flagellar protein FlgN [Bacillaceae]MBU9721730.1 flagellar protein FlgN [Bacillus alkalicola]
MEKTAQELKTILQTMTALHKKFNDKALEKQEIVKKGDMPGLEKLMKEESVLIQQLRKLESTRHHFVTKMLEEKGIVKEDVTMERIMSFFSEEDQKELGVWQHHLVTEITKLQQQNELNNQLIEESLRFVNISLEAVHPQQQFGNYQRPDEKQDEYRDPGTRSIFDSKA